MSRDCPRCGEEVFGSSCKACGWGSSEKKDVPASDFRCSFTVAGQRCNYAGSMSDNTHGRGPWFCGEHFSAMQNENAMSKGTAIIDRSHRDVPTPDYSYEKRRLMALKAMAKRATLVKQ